MRKQITLHEIFSDFPVIFNECMPLRFNVTFLVQDAIDLQLF